MDNDDEREYLLTHRCHDYDRLTERWRAVADCGGLRMEIVATVGEEELPIYALSNGLAPSRQRGLYLSAGVHGDEPAAVEGLIGWAEKAGDFLRSYPLVIFPCLNPAGLMENTRMDHAGRDLNRIFDDGGQEPVRQWQDWLAGKEFRLALCLHEDYDAQGAYVYELERGAAKGIGEMLLEASEVIVPRLPADGVDGRDAEAGVIRPEEDIDAILEEIEGMPEAIYLYLHHTDLALTFETPSEYSLHDRARAQEAAVEAAVGCLG